jgi:LacI family transcriptional regulator
MKAFSKPSRDPADPTDGGIKSNSKSNIKDVARRADVSIATVSRVLNNTCPVHPDKRLRVEKAIEDLKYIPNPAARSLLKRETGGFAILLPFITGEFFSEFLTGLDTTAHHENYFTLVSASHREEEHLRIAIRNVCRRVDGMLIMAPESSTGALRSVIPSGLPVVYVNTRADDQLDDVINFDNFDGAHRMVSHLLDLGHRRIAIINGLPKTFDAIERLRGYQSALRNYGVKLDEQLEIPGDFTQEAGYDGARVLMRMSERPTAVFCANDNTSIGALRAFQQSGIRVPEDIALGGFDDIPMANYLTPPITTVRVPIKVMGQWAVSRLIEKVRTKTNLEPEQRMVPVELVVRGSTVLGQ